MFSAIPSPSSRIAAVTASMIGSILMTLSTSASRRRVATAGQNTGVQLNVGLLGLGTVGAEVAERLLAKRELISARTGVDLNLRRVLVRDLERPRNIPAELLTGRADEILDDPSIQVVVEVMGGEEPARTYLERAIRSGKHIVTANKVVMAIHGRTCSNSPGARTSTSTSRRRS